MYITKFIMIERIELSTRITRKSIQINRGYFWISYNRRYLSYSGICLIA